MALLDELPKGTDKKIFSKDERLKKSFPFGFGIKLDFPRRAREGVKEEVIQMVQDPKTESVIRQLTGFFGFAVLEGITLDRRERDKLGAITDSTKSDELPYIWHRSGDGESLPPPYSVLMSSLDGPPRHSKTVIGRMADVFPVVEQRFGELQEKLEQGMSEERAADTELAKMVSRLRPKLLRCIRSDFSEEAEFGVERVLKELLLTVARTGTSEHADIDFYKELIRSPQREAEGLVYSHEWEVPQTLLVSNRGPLVQARDPAKKRHGSGKLFAIQVGK